jgi:uncharacterized membrane protein YidH (DUF202 family)
VLRNRNGDYSSHFGVVKAVLVIVSLVVVILGLVRRGRMKKRMDATLLEPVGLLWGIVTLIFGLLVIVFPYLLHYIVGIYLIVVGLWAIIPRLHLHLH